VLALIVVAGLSANTQAGTIIDTELSGGPGVLGLQDASRGAVVHNGTVESASGFRTLGANGIAVNDIIFGVISLNNGSNANLNVLYSLQVTAISPVGTPAGTGVNHGPQVTVSFKATDPTSTYSLYHLLSSGAGGLQAQSGLGTGLTNAQLATSAWTSTAFAVVEGGSYNPTANVGAPHTDLALTSTTKVGQSPTLDIIAGLGGANGTAADSFYQVAVDVTAPPSPGQPFGTPSAALSLMVNKTSEVFGAVNPGLAQNYLTGLDPTDTQLNITQAGVGYEPSNYNQNYSFDDQGNLRLNVTGYVPEPSSMIVWSLMACGYGVAAFRRRKNAGESKA
jgi:hypothetical protein